MTIHAKTKDGKLQFDISRDAEKISTFSSGEIDKYEYITGSNAIQSKQNQRKSQIYIFSTRKSIRKKAKQNKTNEDQGIKQIETLKTLTPEENEKDTK